MCELRTAPPEVPVRSDRGPVQRNMVHRRGMRHQPGPTARAVLGDRSRQVARGDAGPGGDGSAFRQGERRVPEQEARGGEYVPRSFRSL